MKNGGENGALPEGWAEAPLRDLLVSLESGKRPRGGVSGLSEGVPSLGGEHLDSHGALDFTRVKYVPQAFASSMRRGHIKRGDVLIVKDGATTGKTALVAESFPFNEAVANEHLFVCRPAEGTSPTFLATFLGSPEGQERILNHFQGSAQGGINRAFATGTIVPVPPLAEQRRIVDHLNKIDHRRASVDAHLQAACTGVDRLRSAVLVAACSGRLTEGWRAQRNDSAAGLVAELCNAVGERKKPTAEPDGGLIHDIPATWHVVSLDLLIDRIEAGKSVRTTGRPAEPDEWGVIKVSAMSWGEFREQENKAVTDRALINPRYEVRSGDLLLSRANTADLVGATVLVGKTRPQLLLSDKSLRLVPRKHVDRAWLNLALRSPLSRAQFSERATGTSESMRNLSQPKILSTTLALPPFDEQREIVRRVDAMLAIADRLTIQVEQVDRTLDRISGAVLAKAFRGELLPTEAALAAEEGRDFESAGELLARAMSINGDHSENDRCR